MNWCARQDLNPHPLGMGPKPIASAYSATGAHIFFNSLFAVKIKIFNCYTEAALPKPTRLPILPEVC